MAQNMAVTTMPASNINMQARYHVPGFRKCVRPNPVTGVVLSEDVSGTGAPHCCMMEREPD
jgi:hypothetical protein